MKYIKMGAVGDLHLLKWALILPEGSDPLAHTFKVLDNAVIIFKQNGVKRAILLGDVFNWPNPDQTTQVRLFAYLLSTGLMWEIILGNHDRSSDDVHSLQLLEFASTAAKFGIRVHTKEMNTVIKGVPVFFQPWSKNPQQPKQPSLAFGHFECVGAVNDNGRQVRNGFNPDKKSFWVSGHLHTYQTVGKHCVFVGAPHQQSFGEKLPKGVAIIEASYHKGRIEGSHTFFPIQPPYILETVDIKKAKQLKKLPRKREGSVLLYRLLIDSRVNVDSREVDRLPGVIKHSFYGTKSERTALAKQNLDLHQEQIVVNPLYGLKNYLTDYGLSAEQIKLGKREVKRLMARKNKGMKEAA